MKVRMIAALLASLVVASPAMADEDMAKLQEEARVAVKELSTRLGGEMKKEMEGNGPVATIKVCRDLAPAIASDISRKSGWRVTRVSQKVRDPLLGMPDAWEQKVLAEFDKRMEKENPANMEFSELVSEPQGKYFRYMKAIPVQGMCLKCHGTPDDVSQSVKDALAAEFPRDKAQGYTLGQIRGAITIKRPMF